MIDTHCHLNFKAFNDDLPQVIERARARGVTKIIVPGTDIASSERAIALAETYENVWAATGIHPHHAKDPNLTVNDNLRQKLEKLLMHKKTVAAGEIGMDYYVYKKTKYPNPEITPGLKTKQRELFVMQMEVACECKKPMILHCRQAHDDMIQTISSVAQTFKDKLPAVKTGDQTISFSLNNSRSEANGVRENSLGFSGVFHCFGGSTDHLRLLLTMGFYIGFDGNITYSEDYQKNVSTTPLDRLLLETDSPYLTPVPYRGTRNEPQYIPLIAEAVAKYHQKPVDEVIHKTTQNALDLFRL